jgi:hypothetical protein
LGNMGQKRAPLGLNQWDMGKNSAWERKIDSINQKS